MFRPKASYLSTLQRLGLTSGLRLCLDAGDAASYSSGQSWLDRSGNGYDFFRGANNTATTDDPTFNGSAGGQSTSEYFSFDGGDFFTYDSANEAWMESIHKDNAKFTICAWVWFGADGVSQGIIGNDAAAGSGTGFSLRKPSGDNTLTFRILGGVKTVTGPLLSTGTWQFCAISLDEAVGASGGFLRVDGTTTTFNSTYTTPSTSNAAFTTQICAYGNNAGALTSGSRIAFIAVWEGVALTSTQVQSIYEASGIAADAGAFALTANTASLGTALPASLQSYTFTGNAAALTPKVAATVGPCALTGQAADLRLAASMIPGACVLTGNAPALTPTANAGVGSYASTGIAATLTATLAAKPQSYAISWQTLSDASTLAANGTAFTLTGNDAFFSYDIDLGGVGSGISGGTFSRGRWHELKELEEAARQQAELARARIEDEAREAAQQRAAEQRAAIAARRSAEDQADDERAQLQAFEDARGALAGAQRASAQLQGARALSAAAAQAQLAAEREEEEEAVVHLLLMA